MEVGGWRLRTHGRSTSVAGRVSRGESSSLDITAGCLIPRLNTGNTDMIICTMSPFSFD